MMQRKYDPDGWLGIIVGDEFYRTTDDVLAKRIANGGTPAWMQINA